MRVVVATTTGFHLRRLALELHLAGVDTRYFSYAPSFRQRQEGLSSEYSKSLFTRLLPGSALAQFRFTPELQKRSVEAMLAATDEYLAPRLPDCDVFIGLSSMAVRSAQAARAQGATVIIDRGARHVLSQAEILRRDGDVGLSQHYIDRELASYKAADYLVVPSKHAADSFLEAGFPVERLITNPLGVDVGHFKPESKKANGVKLLFVGAWSYQKGVDLLVKAVESRPEWQLTHVGMNALGTFPASSQFTSLGYQDHHQLAKTMASHNILVLPSRQDGFGMVLLEGLASGLTIVASDYTGGPDIREIIEQKGSVFIAKAGDPDSLLGALDDAARLVRSAEFSRVLLTPEDRTALSWRGYGARYITLLREIMAKRAATLKHHPMAAS